jgi:hypothetical protein
LGLGDRTDRLRPILIPNLPPIKSISAGGSHSLLLDEQGRIYSFGWNVWGELGLGDRIQRLIPTLISRFQDLELPPRIKNLSAGTYSLISDEEGMVYAFGNNDDGQLGLGDRINRVIPTLVPNIKAKLSSSIHILPLVSPFIRTVYPIIQAFINQNQIVDFRIRSRVNPDLLMEFEHQHGQVYLARVQYDPSTDQISPPIQSESYFELLEELIQAERLSEFMFRDDLPLDQSNRAFEFTDQGQRYLLPVYYDPLTDQIYPPI